MRMVVAKPLASRPCSNYRSFSELVSGATDSSLQIAAAETTMAIRPKIMRLTTPETSSLMESASSLDAVCKPEVFYSSDRTGLGNRSPVIYKPVAKSVSKTTTSRLANLGNFGTSYQGNLAQLLTSGQAPDQVEHHSNTLTTSTTHHHFPPKFGQTPILGKNLRTQLPKSKSEDQISHDGYKWKKYGQKQVKGSDYPRSYYKCTHPNCVVKKKVERSLDGKIVEIVYKGEHNHSKPQAPKLLNSCSQEKVVVVCDVSGRGNGRSGLLCSGENNGVLNGGVETNPSEVCLSGTLVTDLSGYGDHDEPFQCKRRRTEDHASGSLVEPHVTVQTSMGSDVLGDGFRWRKYGQKVVKGNPHPRSYYRCTSDKCKVRKLVERSSDEAGSVITTYEGRHNHA